MSQFRSEEMNRLQVFMARDAAHETLRELGDIGSVQFTDLNHDKSSFNRPHVLEVRKCDDMLRTMRYLKEVCISEKVTAAKANTSHAPPPPASLDELHDRLLETEKEVKVNAQKTRGLLGYVAGCIPTENIKVEEAVSKKSVFIVFFSGDRSKVEIDKIANAYGARKYNLPDTRAAQDESMKLVDERLTDLETVIKRTAEFRRSKLDQINSWVDPWMVHVLKEKAIYHTLNMFNVDSSHQCYIAEGWCPVADMEDVRAAIRRGDKNSSVPAVVNILKPKDCPPTFFRSSKVAAGTQAIVDAYGVADYQEFNPAIFSVVTFPFLFGVMFGDIGHGFMMALAGGLLVAYEKKLVSLASNEMFGTVYKGRYNLVMMGVFATYAGFIYNELFSVPLEIFGSSIWCSGEDHSSSCALPGSSSSSSQKWIRSTLDKAYDFDGDETLNKEVVWSVYPFGTDPGFAHTANKLNSVNSFKMKFAIIAGVAQMVAGICCKLMNTLYFKDNITLLYVFIPEIIFINAIFGYLCLLITVKWTTNWDATFVLNNDAIVSVPQVYCDAALSNLPCWTKPFHYDRDSIPGYGGLLSALPEHQWCMRDGVATAGCAVYDYKGQIVVESNVFGSKSMVDPVYHNSAMCDQDPHGCILWKQSPPSLLDTLIKMFMNIGTVPVADQIVPRQGSLQSWLILFAVGSVPILLVVKPYMLKWKHEKLAAKGSTVGDAPGEEGGGEEAAHGGHGHGGHGFDFGEEMVHQMIHTIEYVLGCISNTASYLRLWALSLAHAQLSEVFWEKTVVEIGLESASALMIFVTVSAWACFTVGVLMGMESLSAFLHALRLHWVEFMNKFYSGTGIKFAPFSFADLEAAAAGGDAGGGD